MTTPAPLLTVGALVAILCWWRGLRSAALFLTIYVAADAIRLALAGIRAGAPIPYQGGAFWAWLVTEVIPAALPPAAALDVVGQRGAGSVIAVGSVIVIGAVYPALRGTTLLAAWSALYVTAYLASSAIVIRRAARRGRLIPDETALLGLLFTGIASVIVIAVYGASAWWAVRITYGTGLVVAAGAAIRPDARRGAPPRAS